MIFATVGTQLAFPRLMMALNDIAHRHNLKILAQTGDNVKYEYIESIPSLRPLQYDQIISDSNLIVAHAGIGTILSAKKHRKPLIIFPRRASLGEHRNDHQLATAKAIVNARGIRVAETESELEKKILTSTTDTPSFDLPFEDNTLILRIKNLIDEV